MRERDSQGGSLATWSVRTWDPNQIPRDASWCSGNIVCAIPVQEDVGSNPTGVFSPAFRASQNLVIEEMHALLFTLTGDEPADQIVRCMHFKLSYHLTMGYQSGRAILADLQYLVLGLQVLG